MDTMITNTLVGMIIILIFGLIVIGGIGIVIECIKNPWLILIGSIGLTVSWIVGTWSAGGFK